MSRSTTTETTEGILDKAAGLLASLGPRDLSVQVVADATSLAKSSILYRFGSRQALLDAAVQQCVQEAVTLGATGGDDGARVRALVELSSRRPGGIRLMIAGVTTLQTTSVAVQLRAGVDALYGFFGVDLDDPLADPGRSVRVTGALAAVAAFAACAPPHLPLDARVEAVEGLCVDILAAGPPACAVSASGSVS